MKFIHGVSRLRFYLQPADEDLGLDLLRVLDPRPITGFKNVYRSHTRAGFSNYEALEQTINDRFYGYVLMASSIGLLFGIYKMLR